MLCKPNYLDSLMGSEPTAAGGGKKEASEWPRSVCNAAAPSARRTPGTATGAPVVQTAKEGNYLFINLTAVPYTITSAAPCITAEDA